jgi:DNA adenine methylase
MRPLLKWAGGKRWLLPVLQDVWSEFQDLRLVEPFTGGMAVALGLNPSKALLNDNNEHLINFYQQIRKGFNIQDEMRNNESFYYKQRQRFNDLIEAEQHLTPEAAALFYYLMRTGFNGLCRFNSSGGFNVPFGQHNTINYRRDFSEYKIIFKNWHFKNQDFEKIKLNTNDFVYADPPYDVEFRRYSKEDFSWQDQIRLAEWLCKHTGPVIASNQATKRILELYQDLGFTVYTLTAPRFIACNGDRTPALEMLAVRNLEPLRL